MVTPEAFISPIPVRSELRDVIIGVLQTSLPNWTPQQSDPGYYIADDIAERIIRFIEQHNAGAAELYPLTASVEGLVQLLDNIGVAEATGTSTELLQQYRNRWNSLAASTTEFSRDLVRKFNDELVSIEVARDVVRSKALIFATKANGVVLTADESLALETKLNDDRDTPTKIIWWDYVVLPPWKIGYTLSARIWYKVSLMSLADVKVLVEERLTAAVNSLARLNTTIGSSIIEQAIYDINTKEFPVITLVQASLVPAFQPTIGANPVNWRAFPENLGPKLVTTLYELSGALAIALPGIRPILNAPHPQTGENQPYRFLTNRFRPIQGQLIRIALLSAWTITGRIGVVSDYAVGGETGFGFQVIGRVSTGDYAASQLNEGDYQLGPIPYYYFDDTLTDYYMPANLGVIYGPGTFNPTNDLQYIAV